MLAAADTQWLVRGTFGQPVTHSAAFGVCLFRMSREDARIAVNIAELFETLKALHGPYSLNPPDESGVWPKP